MRKLPRTIQTLKKRTDTLNTLIRQSADDRKLYKAADKLREAKIQVLRAKIGEMPSPLLTAPQKKRIARLSKQIDLLTMTATAAIVEEARPTDRSRKS